MAKPRYLAAGNAEYMSYFIHGGLSCKHLVVTPQLSLFYLSFRQAYFLFWLLSLTLPRLIFRQRTSCPLASFCISGDFHVYKPLPGRGQTPCLPVRTDCRSRIACSGGQTRDLLPHLHLLDILVQNRLHNRSDPGLTVIEFRQQPVVRRPLMIQEQMFF
jgi:hypothetical protein